MEIRFSQQYLGSMQSVILYLHRCQPGCGLSSAYFPLSLLKQPCIDLEDLCTPGPPRLYPRTRPNISLSTSKRMPAVFEHITHFLVSVWTWLSPCNAFAQLPSLVRPGSVLWTCISHQCDPDTGSFCKTLKAVPKFRCLRVQRRNLCKKLTRLSSVVLFICSFNLEVLGMKAWAFLTQSKCSVFKQYPGPDKTSLLWPLKGSSFK